MPPGQRALISHRQQLARRVPSGGRRTGQPIAAPAGRSDRGPIPVRLVPEAKARRQRAVRQHERRQHHEPGRGPRSVARHGADGAPQPRHDRHDRQRPGDQTRPATRSPRSPRAARRRQRRRPPRGGRRAPSRRGRAREARPPPAPSRRCSGTGTGRCRAPGPAPGTSGRWNGRSSGATDGRRASAMTASAATDHPAHQRHAARAASSPGRAADRPPRRPAAYRLRRGART